MNHIPKEMPDIEDLRFLLALAENWANLDGKTLRHRSVYRPMQIANASPMMAAAIEIFDWLAGFNQGENLLREEKLLVNGKNAKEIIIGKYITCP